MHLVSFSVCVCVHTHAVVLLSIIQSAVLLWCGVKLSCQRCLCDFPLHRGRSWWSLTAARWLCSPAASAHRACNSSAQTQHPQPGPLARLPSPAPANGQQRQPGLSEIAFWPGWQENELDHLPKNTLEESSAAFTEKSHKLCLGILTFNLGSTYFSYWVMNRAFPQIFMQGMFCVFRIGLCTCLTKFSLSLTHQGEKMQIEEDKSKSVIMLSLNFSRENI